MMRETRLRLEVAAAMLSFIERQRCAGSEPTLGADLERLIVEQELRELQRDIASDPGALRGAPATAPVRRRSGPA